MGLAATQVKVEKPMHAFNIVNNIPDEVIPILKQIGKLADVRSCSVYAVGGFVRDLLLGVENHDIDIAVEGDGIGFAKELAEKFSGRLVVHKRFGTATVFGELKIDIATARRERYKHPAALPEVSFSSLKQDLYRRDFTINAMAFSLNRKRFGYLIDFFGGQRDLKAKRIRVLHELSFVEDPTRIFRAVRFEQRYNFTIEPHTEDLIKTAVSLNMFERTQKQRLRNEIMLILKEEDPKKALIRMHKLHELHFIHPNIKYKKKMIDLFDSIDKACKWYADSVGSKSLSDKWLIYLMAMLEDVSLKQLEKLCKDFVFTSNDKKRLLLSKDKAKELIDTLHNTTDISPSKVYRCLKPLPVEVAIFILAESKTRIVKNKIKQFLSFYSKTKLSIRGSDIKALGIKPGPEYKKFLTKILHEKLDGKVDSKSQELELLERLLKKR